MPPQQRHSWHDAYDAQMELWRWYRTETGTDFLQASFATHASEVDDEGTKSLIMDLHKGERARLLDLDPIYVSEEMCEVVEAAAETFEPEPLLETDLLTPRGFLFYERSFDVPQRFDTPTWIKGISWQRIFNSGESMTTEEHAKFIEHLREQYSGEGPGWMEHMEDELEKDDRLFPWGTTLTIYTDTAKEGFSRPERFPRIVPLHMTPWYFGMVFDAESTAEWWWKIVQVTLRLMQQRIAVKHFGKPDRASRREGKKLQIPDEREVVVVRLRRESGEPSEPTGEKANYSHRFIRSGHWRNQWYPSIHKHRQIWISPMVVGDPSLPLIVRPRRVWKWDR